MKLKIRILLYKLQGLYVTCPLSHPLCGILTIESGLASGVYDTLGVHGLWPETGKYGDSIEVTPLDKSFDKEGVLNGPASREGCSCWAELTGGEPTFAEHEWTKHGYEAGAKDSVNYFNVACDLATNGADGGPVGVMKKAIKAGATWDELQKVMKSDANYGRFVYLFDQEHDQVEYGACATCSGSDGKSAPCSWELCELKPGPVPPAPGPAPDTCEPGEHGPSCKTDSDCTDVPKCVRCAHSGKEALAAVHMYNYWRDSV
ncbi:hypothetical protein CYMTET_39006 [Cymbomonas tetramitiformis]|uniref:Uncharacterized protein n=1 Tax=Cymbomonas tetramitiformis TaxID=36881 RepID=A0AAE0F4C9_9CHLO|nr:hypothetical protein CYMTET_39006 [Cymbomonas tetramitiformis]